MVDIFTVKNAAIFCPEKGKGTKLERHIRKLLYKIGYRFRLHQNKLPAKPDIVLPKYKTEILFMAAIGTGRKNLIAMLI